MYKPSPQLKKPVVKCLSTTDGKTVQRWLECIPADREKLDRRYFLNLILAFYSKFLANQGRIVEARSIGEDALNAAKCLPFL